MTPWLPPNEDVPAAWETREALWLVLLFLVCALVIGS